MKVELTPAQKDFWERKKDEIRRQSRLSGCERRVTNSTVFQGLVDAWMKLEQSDEANPSEEVK